MLTVQILVMRKLQVGEGAEKRVRGYGMWLQGKRDGEIKGGCEINKDNKIIIRLECLSQQGFPDGA